MPVLRQAKRNITLRFLHRVAHRDFDAPFEFANVVHVCVDARLVAGTETGFERAELPDDSVEDAGVALTIAQPLFRARAIAEEPLERHTRIYLRRQWRRRRRPGDRVRIRAAVSPVAIAEVARVLDAELQRRQDRVLPVLVGDELIYRH